MHTFLKEIKKFEKKPIVIKNFLNNQEIENFLKLYDELPVEVNNLRQKIVKKKWSTNYLIEFQKIYKKIRKVIGEYSMDNPKIKTARKFRIVSESKCQYHYTWTLVLILIK